MITIINPATEAPIAELPSDTFESVAHKYERARQGLTSWSTTDFKDRAACLKRFGELLSEQAEACAKDLTAETGKPIAQALGEVRATQGRIRFFLENTEPTLKTRPIAPMGSGTGEEIRFEPLGVVANISAWNYPYFVGANVFLPALLTGNTVLYKPSELALLTGANITRLLHEAGVPDDAFQMVTGDGIIGSHLLEQNIDGAFFTGSFETGQKIAQQLAGRMIKVQLELGGKDPAYVCDDVDIEKVAEGLAEGAFYNAGQSCCAVERIYVHEAVYDDFCRAYTAAAIQWKPGDPTDKKTNLGPLTRAAQIQILEAQLKDATDKGGKLAVEGGKVEGKGSYFSPAVVTHANHEMSLMRDESFGPVIGIQKVAHDEEALALMQDTEYGLTASVFTQNRARAEQILTRINSGTVYWNCCDRVSPALPWSGRGHSGVGLTCSVAGIEAFLKPKAWHFRSA
ncbi:MAG: aldehyde dehydrogenase [Myxococcales bacterium]|nr:aldehyde dehydrogenase [Myxococcales bacterium]